MTKKIIFTMAIVFILTSVTPCYGMVDGIDSTNYLTYEKIYKDDFGYNKGECEKPYLKGEEIFYNEYYDHWNVDKVYDKSIVKKTIKTKKNKKKKSIDFSF